MSQKHLFGPVNKRFVERNLLEHCATGNCLPFDSAGKLPFTITDADDWPTLIKRLPAGWRPDFVVLDLHYTTIPQCLWQAPVPLIGLATDWNWLWHAERRLLRHVDLILTDTQGVERLAQEGIHHTWAANLFGLEAGWLSATPATDSKRDIDVLFAGNMHPAVQRERLAWLGRLASIGEHWNVSIVRGVFDEDYRNLARRARIIFNRSIRGECNMRAFEAAAAGALLFQEEGNREIGAYFRDRQECVLYNDQNLEELLNHYLEHEDERRGIAEAAQCRVEEFTFAKLWQGYLERIEQEWAGVQERARKRCGAGGSIGLTARMWQALGSGRPGDDTNLVQDLVGCQASGSDDRLGSLSYVGADLHNAIGMALALTSSGGELQPIGEAFARAVRCDAKHPVARLNLVEALVKAGQRDAAFAEARTALAKLAGLDVQYSPPLDKGGLGGSSATSTSNRVSPPDNFPEAQKFAASSWLDAPRFPQGFDFFRVEWERAAWQHAGDREGEASAKRALLRWRLHHLLAELTQDIPHYYEAVLARPDLPTTQAALGCALARNGQPALAVPHLRLAVRQNPFDLGAARALFQVLKDAGDRDGQREFVRERRLLAKAAPRLVPHEPWFDEPGEADEDLLRSGHPETPKAGGNPQFSPPWQGGVGGVSESTRQSGERVGSDGCGGCNSLGNREVAADPPSPPLARGGERPEAKGEDGRSQPRFFHVGPDPCLFNIVWEGDHKEVHSLGVVNRALCGQLLLRGHKLAALPSGHHDSQAEREAKVRQLEAFFRKAPRGSADVYVRHQWPPRFEPPGCGRWVMMQPWEFGSLPRAWIEPMSHRVDEIWVASHWVRQCYIESGVPGDRVHVIRQGVDPVIFHPNNTPMPLQTRKRFKFLFVGGSIRRKGIDLLLDAYARTFTRTDDVCLVIKDMGIGTFYQGMTAERRIAELRATPGAPEIEYLAGNLTTSELAGLYTACDCLVHPFRGEGFGLPMAEAMASGRAVIVTGYGPALDFCSDETAYLIPGQVRRFAEKKVGDEPTVDYPWLAEPDVGVLQTLMRHVFHHPEEARAKGAAAHKHIHTHFTWAHAAAEIEARLAIAGQKPVENRAKTFSKPSSTANGSGFARHSPPATHHFLSACLIVKNEESNLGACLESIQGVADEVIVVDTGSVDRTKEIALQHGARVFDFPWVDSFSAARNECLRHATGEWIFWLDADDRLNAENRERLREFIGRLRNGEHSSDSGPGTAGSPFDAFVMTCRCLSNRADGIITEVQHVRLFRNHPQMRWEFRIHEQILPAVKRLGGVARFTDVVVEHVGYQDPGLRIRKRERDLRLLEMEYAEQPNHPFTLFNLGMTYLDLKRSAEALDLLQRSLDRSAPPDSIVRKLYYMIVQCHRQMDRKEDALAACRKGLVVYPQDAELLGQVALLLNEANDLIGAEQCYLKLLSERESPHFSSVPVGLNGFLTRHNLANIYRRQGRVAEAELQWRAAVAEKPEFESAWLGLEDLFVVQCRWADLETLASEMEKRPALGVQAYVARARGHLGRKEFDAAKMLLHEIIGKEPKALRPRVLLSHVLLQEGSDTKAAEQALLDVLALDPGNTEAKNNLAVLRASNKAPTS